jgi:hypothetical protein
MCNKKALPQLKPPVFLVRDPAFPLLISGGFREKKSMGLLAYSGGVFRIGGLAWREGKHRDDEEWWIDVLERFGRGWGIRGFVGD